MRIYQLPFVLLYFFILYLLGFSTYAKAYLVEEDEIILKWEQKYDKLRSGDSYSNVVRVIGKGNEISDDDLATVKDQIKNHPPTFGDGIRLSDKFIGYKFNNNGKLYILQFRNDILLNKDNLLMLERAVEPIVNGHPIWLYVAYKNALLPKEWSLSLDTNRLVIYKSSHGHKEFYVSQKEYLRLMKLLNDDAFWNGPDVFGRTVIDGSSSILKVKLGEKSKIINLLFLNNIEQNKTNQSSFVRVMETYDLIRSWIDDTTINETSGRRLKGEGVSPKNNEKLSDRDQIPTNDKLNE